MSYKYFPVSKLEGSTKIQSPPPPPKKREKEQIEKLKPPSPLAKLELEASPTNNLQAVCLLSQHLIPPLDFGPRLSVVS